MLFSGSACLSGDDLAEGQQCSYMFFIYFYLLMELRRCQEHGFSAKRRGGLQEPMSLAMQSDTLVCGDCSDLYKQLSSEPCITNKNGASEEAGYRSR